MSRANIPGQAKEVRPPMLKWLKPGSKWRAAVLIVAGSENDERNWSQAAQGRIAVVLLEEVELKMDEKVALDKIDDD